MGILAFTILIFTVESPWYTPAIIFFFFAFFALLPALDRVVLAAETD